MMGTRLPETCWATIRREIKNTKSDIQLVFLIHNKSLNLPPQIHRNPYQPLSPTLDYTTVCGEGHDDTHFETSYVEFRACSFRVLRCFVYLLPLNMAGCDSSTRVATVPHRGRFARTRRLSCQIIFRRVRKIPKSDYSLSHFCPSVRTHETTRFPLDGFSWNLKF